MRKIRLLFFLFVLTAPLLLRAGQLERGYEALRIFDYFRARSCFEASYDRHPLGAAYGLSLIHSRSDNPFFSLTKAHARILEALHWLKRSGPKEKARLAAFGVNDSAVFLQKKKIEGMAYEYALGADDLESWNLFLGDYGDAPQYAAALARRNEIAFQLARSSNRWQSYKEYSERYPMSARAEEAYGLYEKLLYESLTAGNSIGEYESYLLHYPKGRYRDAAEDALFRLSTADRSIASFHAFIKKYPGNRNIAAAWNSIYTLYTSDYTPEKIAEFFLAFPDFPDKETIGLDMRLSVTEFFPVRENGKSGFMDSTGLLMIPCRYDWVDAFSEGLAAAGKGDKAGYISKSGKLVVPFEYDEAGAFRKGFAMVKKGDYYGLIDKTGTLVLPVKYDEIYDFYESRAVIVRNGKYGYADRSGTEVVAPQYDKAGDFAGGLAYVVKDGKYGFIDRDGNTVVAPAYDWVENFRYGTCRVRKNEFYGLLGRDSLLLPCAYEYIGEFSEGLALAARDGSCGFIDRKGKTVIPFEYEFLPQLAQDGGFRNGRARMYKKAKCGFIDTAGKTIVPFDYDDALYPTEKLTAVKRRDKWGFADEKQKLRIDYQYEQVAPFREHRARIKKDGQYGFITPAGKTAVPATYDEAGDVSHGLIIVKKAGRYGIIDPDNNFVLLCEYDKIGFISPVSVRLEKDGRWAYYHLLRCGYIWKEEGF